MPDIPTAAALAVVIMIGCKTAEPLVSSKKESLMSNLNLSVAVGDYDRNRPLINGAVRIDGVDPVFMTLSPEIGSGASRP